MLGNIAWSCLFIYLFLTGVLFLIKEGTEEYNNVSIVNGIIAIIGIICVLIAGLVWVWT